jgi:RHS repeat-associated protein
MKKCEEPFTGSRAKCGGRGGDLLLPILGRHYHNSFVPKMQVIEDHQRFLIAGSASVQGNQAYGPYGNSRYQAGSLGTAKGFTGQYQDATGLDYYNARYYDPVVGRFLSADIVEGNAVGMDPYAYVGDNPETYNDPTGHCAWYDILCDLTPSWQNLLSNLQKAWNEDLNAAQQTGQILIQTGKNIVIWIVISVLLVGAALVIIWNAVTKGIIAGLRGKNELIGATINLLIFTVGPNCPTCAAKIPQWILDILEAAGVDTTGADVHLYFWWRNPAGFPPHVPGPSTLCPSGQASCLKPQEPN